MRRTSRYAFLAAFFLAGASAASAQTTTTYFGDSTGTFGARNMTAPNAAQALFLSQFANFGTDNFESYLASTQVPPVFNPPPAVYNGINGVAVTYTANAITVGSDPGFQFSTSPVQYLSEASQVGVNQVMTFAFSRPVQGFGAFFINVADGVTNSFTVTLQNGAGPARNYAIDVPTVTNGTGIGNGTPNNFSGRQFDSAFYWGIKDTDPFDQVTITAASNQDGVLFDDLSVGFITAIPEPGTVALIGGLGLAGVGGYFYKRRQNVKKQDKRFSMAR
ncbi:MAG: PEP-CTERM sorting domain-containing protein [Gemmatales bacterium]